MPRKLQFYRLLFFIFVLIIANSFRDNNNTLSKTKIAERKPGVLADDPLKGAWKTGNKSGDEVLIFIDNYITHTAYSANAKKFLSTKGGTYRIDGNKIMVHFEFSTPDKNLVGTDGVFTFSAEDKRLITNLNGANSTWSRIDDGSGALAGNWQITGRVQGDKMNEMRPGARKTIKILSGSRFQWAAINTETKEFSGSGGGNYTFSNGKYTENIEFFSRDSSRVGASLSFDGAVEDGKWIHKGLSSRGEKIHEVWSRPSLSK